LKRRFLGGRSFEGQCDSRYRHLRRDHASILRLPRSRYPRVCKGYTRGLGDPFGCENFRFLGEYRQVTKPQKLNPHLSKRQPKVLHEVHALPFQQLLYLEMASAIIVNGAVWKLNATKNDAHIGLA
jgi:hypothetical protein